MPRRSSAFAVLGVTLILFVLALVLLETSVTAPVQAVGQGIQVITSEGFEGTYPPTGWSSTGHWGKSACQASDGANSAWIEGGATDRACTGFDSIYHPSETATLRYGPFDLSDALTATLTFDLWLWQAQGDTFTWGASIDGAAFHGITATDAFTTLWAAQSLDLGAVPGLGDLRGQSAVYVGFVWQSDDFAETFSGAFVDNVRIVKGVTGGTGEPTASTTATNTPTDVSTTTPTGEAHVYLPAVNGAPVATHTATATATATATNVPGNHAPVFPTPFLTEKVTENEYDGNGRLVGATTTITILTPATDQDGDPLTYTWSASNGSIAGNGLVGVWTRVIENGRAKKGIVTVIAADGRGGTAQVNFEVN